MTQPVYPIPLTLSPSRIGSFRSCPLQFRFASIEKLPEPPQIHLVKGNFVHRVLELLLSHPPDDRTVDAARASFAQAQQEYESSPRFVALGLGDDAHNAFWQDSRDLVNGYYRMENPRTTNVIGLELRLRTNLGKFVLSGILDRLEHDANGDLVVSDYKTGKMPMKGRDEAVVPQKMDNMHLYASLCLRTRGELPKKLRLMYLKTSTPIEAFVTKETNATCEAAAIETFDQIASSCQSGEFATKKSGLCNFCAFQRWCPEFGGDPIMAHIEAPKIYPVIRDD